MKMNSMRSGFNGKIWMLLVAIGVVAINLNFSVIGANLKPSAVPSLRAEATVQSSELGACDQAPAGSGWTRAHLALIPEPSSVIAGLVLLMPLAASTARFARQRTLNPRRRQLEPSMDTSLLDARIA